MGQLLVRGKVIGEALLIDGEALLRRQLAGHLDRVAIGVVQVERIQTIDHGLVAQTGDDLGELLLALAQRARKAGLLKTELFEHECLVLLELRIDLGILVDDDLRDLAGEALAHADAHAVAHGAADQAAQDVALIDIARGHAARIAHNEGGGAQVIGDDAERLGGRRIVLIALAGQLGDLGEDTGKCVGLVHGLAAVQRADGALQAHAGIDVLLLHRNVLALAVLVVLHEHVVPDLHEAAAGAGRGAIRAAGRLIADDEHLGVRAARAGLARRAPPVVLSVQEIDVLRLDALRHPVAGGLVVTRDVVLALEHGERQLVLVKAQVLRAGQELPGPGDHVLLEIIAQRPVAQHFKEGQVGGIADLVDVAGADALLHVGEAGAGRVLAAQQVRNQRVHARGGKEHGRVVLRNDGSAGDDRVTLALKEVQPHRAQLAGSHLLHCQNSPLFLHRSSKPPS